MSNVDRKNVILWTLYDFANSIVEVVLYLYFAQWLVIDKGVSDLWFNMIFVGSTILLILTAPFFGTLSDSTGVQKRYLNRTTWLFFLSALLISLVTMFWSGQYILAALLFLLANYFYQLSFTFYNAMLGHLAPPEKQGIISGIGQAGNWVGQIAGLLLSIPLVAGTIYLFGEAGRAQTFLPATIIFILLALPMMLYYKERSSENKNISLSYRKELVNTWRSFHPYRTK